MNWLRIVHMLAWAYCILIGGYILLTPNGPIPINTVTGIVGVALGVISFAGMFMQGSRA